MVQSSHTVQSTSLYSTPADRIASQAQHDRIKASDAQLSAAYQDLQGQIKEQKGRCQSAEQNLKQAGSDLEAARIELQRVRGEAFERSAGSGGVQQGAPPPQYAA